MHIMSAKALTDSPAGEFEAELALPDGRSLSYATLGAKAVGAPVVIVLDGPGSRGLARAAAPIADKLGIKLVAPDRPGSGRSSAAPGRTVTSWASDHAALLDAVGASKAGILSQSGGTPFALAVAAELPQRTTGLALLGAVAPLDDPAAFAETGKQLRNVLNLARRAPWLLKIMLGAASRSVRRNPDKAARKFLKGIPPADAAQLEDPELWALHVRATQEILARPAGFVDEVILLSAPWGIDISAITVPAAFWSGADDATHPTSHSRRLAALLGGDSPITVVEATATFGLLPHYADALQFALGRSI
jgi:pimeloyl-ACP methyl ester carboxylesterase